MDNPFRFGGTLGRDDIVDRQEEIKQVVETIKDGEKLFLIGPRRYGKTTIMHAARQLCEEKGMTALYFNAEAFPTLADLTQRIFAVASKALIPATTKAKASLKDLFSRVKPEINFNLLEQTVSGSITIEEERPAEQVHLLVDVLDGIEKLASAVKRPVGLILDEFQHIIELGGRSAEGQLRAAVQDHRKVGYIFAGSKTRMLAEMTNDHARPFYRLGSRRFLKKIPAAELIPWLAQQFSKGKIAASEEVLKQLLATVEDVPYDIQKLAKTCFTLFASNRQTKLTPDMIEQACLLLLEEDGELYANLWNQLTSYQKLTLIEARRARGTGLTSRASLKRTKLSASTMRKGLEALRYKSILREEEKPDDVRWRFEDPLFAMWVEQLNRAE